MSIFMNYHSNCCGLKELHGLSFYTDPSAAMLDLCETLYPTGAAHEALIAKVLKRAERNADELNPRVLLVGENAGGTQGIEYFNVQRPPVECVEARSNAVFQSIEQYARFRFLTFTEAISPSYRDVTQGEDAPSAPRYGRKFAAFIEKNKLGEVTATGRHINPNSLNWLKVWIWAIDHAALRAWYTKHSPKVKETPKQAPSILGEPGVPQWVENLPSSGYANAGLAGIPYGGTQRTFESTLTYVAEPPTSTLNSPASLQRDR